MSKEDLREALKNLRFKTALSKVYGLRDKLPFGKFAGCTIRTIIDRKDPRYIKRLLGKEVIELDKKAFEYYKKEIEDLESRLIYIDNKGAEVDLDKELESWSEMFDRRE